MSGPLHLRGPSGRMAAAAVELVVGGLVHRGWRAMKATLSLDAPAAKFTLDLAERWSPEGLPRSVKPGAPCQLRLDGEVVVDGWIDAVEANYDERDHVLTVVARDRIGDLVDCAAVLDGAHEWSNLRLEEIARRLAQPYGVRVVREAEPGAPFPRFAIQPGETAWEALERAARARGVLLAGDGTGTLRLTRASLAGCGAGPIVLGGNVRRARASFDHSQRHSVVVVRGQSEGGSIPQGVHEETGAATPGGERLLAARGQGRQEDPAITRNRPRVIVAEAAGDAPSFAARAAFEMRQAAGRGTRAAYTVPGWRGAAGALWRTATLVPVLDRFLGLDAELLVSGVTFSLTPQDGSVTEVEVTLPDAYDVRVQPLKATGGGRAGQGLGVAMIEDPPNSGRYRPARPDELR